LDGDDILIIRWAHDEPSPDTIKRKEIEDSVLIRLWRTRPPLIMKEK